MYLKGFLCTVGIHSFQMDLGLDVILRLFSSSSLTEAFDRAERTHFSLSANACRIISLRADYLRTIDPVIRYLQNKNPTLAHAICEGDFLPQASRFSQLDDLDWAFGTMGTQDKARHLATLYLEDISDLIIEAIDPHFGFSRYAERLALSASSFDALEDGLNGSESLVDRLMIELLEERVREVEPTLVALSVPFPGNLYAALRCGKWLKQHHPHIAVAMGGGYPNTELRSLSDPRVFKYVDFISLDDGETPLIHLLEHLDGSRTKADLKRTFTLDEGKVTLFNGSKTRDIPQSQIGTPDYSDLHLDSYLSVIEMANPMHRMWSDGRWNKLTLAHGCYWGKCTFCDISLDYIQRYEPSTAKLLCDRMETIIAQTGETGFHFVDEAAPPSLMKELALEILRRKLTVVWWTNIRFEKSFTYDLCRLLKESGCIAVSGGLEVASDRLLKLIDKGVTVQQVACVTDNFTRSGIMVHAYLMYGFPTQTAQETIDSLEVVRQMFEIGILQSGFWHRFAMTAHSPVGIDPKAFHVEIGTSELGTFANNEIGYFDPTGADHEIYGEGLRKSLFNYMHGIGFDMRLKEWFDFRVPRTKVPSNFIEQALGQNDDPTTRSTTKIVWIGGKLGAAASTKSKNQKLVDMVVSNRQQETIIQLDPANTEWTMRVLSSISVRNGKPMSFKDFESDYSKNVGKDFAAFWNSETMLTLKENGLLVL